MAQRRMVAQQIQDNGMSLEQGHKIQQQLAARQQVRPWHLGCVGDMPQMASSPCMLLLKTACKVEHLHLCDSQIYA